MMAKEPAKRYQTGRELLQDIARLRERLSGQTAALSPAVELVPATSGQGTDGAQSVNLAGATAPVPSWTPQRWGWRGVVFVCSLLLAATLGTAFASFHHRRAFPIHDPVVAASEEHTANKLETEEQALRTLVEKSLDTRPGNFPKVQEGIQLGMNLGIIYLEQDRLDDALALFVRLEQHQVLAFQVLGHLGKGIVLALKNEPQESIKHFKWADGKVHNKPIKWLENKFLADPQWRYWITKAIHYNLQNGLGDREVPGAFRPFVSR
jgi:hypothetical protein